MAWIVRRANGCLENYTIDWINWDFQREKSSLNPYERARRGLEVLTDKRNLSRPLRVPGRGTQPTEVSEGGTTVSSQILNVPEYQEENRNRREGFQHTST